jgi:DNA polymerase-3 subunit beta
MKFTVLRNELASALSTVMGATERTGTLQILRHILIEAADGCLGIVGTNLEMELRTEAAATVEMPGRATVPARKLYDLVKGLPEGAELRIEFEPRKALVKCGRSRYTLPVLPADEMPMLDVTPLKSGTTFEIEERALKQMMQSVLFAVAEEDVRAYLTGMLLHLADGEVRAVGGSNVSMARAASALPVPANGDIQTILINKSAREIVRLLSDTDHKAKVRVCTSMIHLELASCSITTKAIEGRYPEYDRVIALNVRSTMRIDREVLLRALARTAIVTNVHKAVRLTPKADSLELTTAASDNEAGDECIDAKFDGPADFEIGFSISALSEVISALPPGEVVFNFETPLRHAQIQSAANDDRRYAVMPMRL